ncbi:hypothetical protein V8F20_012112 [Naviculisporaceae sp. PSN 640]
MESEKSSQSGGSNAHKRVGSNQDCPPTKKVATEATEATTNKAVNRPADNITNGCDRHYLRVTDNIVRYDHYFQVSGAATNHFWQGIAPQKTLQRLITEMNTAIVGVFPYSAKQTLYVSYGHAGRLEMLGCAVKTDNQRIGGQFDTIRTKLQNDGPDVEFTIVVFTGANQGTHPDSADNNALLSALREDTGATPALNHELVEKVKALEIEVRNSGLKISARNASIRGLRERLEVRKNEVTDLEKKNRFLEQNDKLYTIKNEVLKRDKEDLEEEKEVLKETLRKEKETMKETLRREKEVLKETLRREKETMKETLRREKETMKETLRREKEVLKETLRREKEVMKDTLRREKEVMKEILRREKEDGKIRELAYQHQEEEVEALKQSLDDMRSRFKDLINRYKAHPLGLDPNTQEELEALEAGLMDDDEQEDPEAPEADLTEDDEQEDLEDIADLEAQFMEHDEQKE